MAELAGGARIWQGRPHDASDRKQAMTRLLVLNGGASVKPDRSGAYLNLTDPLALFEQRGVNTGDIVVYDAIIRHLEFTSLQDIGFGVAAQQKRWPVEPPDATIIRGSNYLSAQLDLTEAVPLIRHLRGPIVPIGLGAQAANYGPIEMPRGSVEFWREVAGKCTSLGVRGAYSAEILASIGIHNIRIIGCPSFYRMMQPELRIRAVAPEQARLGLTLNRHLAGPYTSNRFKTIRLQRALIAAAAGREGSRIFSQGEREESLMPLVPKLRQAELLAHVLGNFQLQEDGAAAALLSQRMSAHLDPDEWARDLGDQVDFMLGFRVHGTVMALQQGIPGVYFTYDSRIREIASLYRVPSIEIEDFAPIDLEQTMAAADFRPFEKAYRENYAEYLLFLDENGLRHRLPPALSPPRVAAPDGQPERLPMTFTDSRLAGWYRGEWEALNLAHEALTAQAHPQFIHRGRA